jgi:hypothetical protein
MILKAINKTGSLGSCFVCMDIGSSERLAMQSFYIPNTAETRIVPKWLFPPRFSDQNRFTSQPSGCCIENKILEKKRKEKKNYAVTPNQWQRQIV